MKEKICRDCGLIKPMTEFWKAKKIHEPTCKLCRQNKRRKHDRQKRIDKGLKVHVTKEIREKLKLEGKKYCPMCKKGRYYDEFENKFKPYCKECSIKYWENYSPERSAAKSRRSYMRNKDNQRNHTLKHLFGITLADYNRMLKEQNFVCAVCEKTVEQNKKALSVDHCHVTGKVRALLCTTCNLGMGVFNDNIELLQKAIEYLQKHK